MNATNVHTNTMEHESASKGGHRATTANRAGIGSVIRRRLPAWAGIGFVLGCLFASTSSFVAGVSYWRALPAAQMAVFLNLIVMLPLLYWGVIRHGHGSFRGALARTSPGVLAAQIPAGLVNTWLIDTLFSYMMLMGWWTTFAMLTGTALAVCLLGLPLTIHYEQLRGQLFRGDETPDSDPGESPPDQDESRSNRIREVGRDAPEPRDRDERDRHAIPGIWLPLDSGRKLVRFEEILYLTSHGHTVVIHTDGRDYKRAMLMKRLGTELPARAFMRVHKSHMLNLARVERLEYSMGGAYIAFMNDEGETEVPVGRTYAAALKQALGLS